MLFFTRVPRATLLLSLGSVALVAAAPPPKNIVKQGVDAWGRGDYTTAISDWREAARRNDPDAEFNLGQAYKLGRGVPADTAQAEQWYAKAAAQGHVQAADNYGLTLFQNGKMAQAVPWLEKSAARGEPRAQLVLGTMLFNGDGGQPKNWPRAYALMVRASAQGLPQATQTLKQMDTYIPLEQRQQGLALARQYESEAQKPALPPELAAATPQPSRIRTTALPPSDAAPKAAPGTSYPIPGTAATPAPPRPASARPGAIVPAAPSTPEGGTDRRRAPPAKPAREAPDSGWRVQVGAFAESGNAQKLWSRLRHVAPLAGHTPFYEKAGGVTKLQIGYFATHAEADAACSAAKRAGAGCLPIAP